MSLTMVYFSGIVFQAVFRSLGDTTQDTQFRSWPWQCDIAKTQQLWDHEGHPIGLRAFRATLGDVWEEYHAVNQIWSLTHARPSLQPSELSP